MLEAKRLRFLRLEQLESRVLLHSGSNILDPHPVVGDSQQINQLGKGLTVGANAASQLVFLDLDGAENVRYQGPVVVSGIDVPPFHPPSHMGGQEAKILASTDASLEQELAGSGVVFTTDQPAAGQEYSTVFIGGDGAAFADYGLYYGLAEQVDFGNQDRSDNALVFTENIPDFGLTADAYGQVLAGYVAHETGHLLGLAHTEEYALAHHEAEDPLGEVAWRPYTHVEIAKDVRSDLIEDGQLTIVGGEYAVHPKIVDALRRYPSFYYGGTVAGDGFPDVVFGQHILHPVDTGVWMRRVLDMA